MAAMDARNWNAARSRRDNARNGTRSAPRQGRQVAYARYRGRRISVWVVIKGSSGPGATAYVSSLRDREIDVVNLQETCTTGTAPPSCTVATVTPVVISRIPVKGQPNKMTMNQAQTLLYVGEDESDTVDVITS